MTMAILELVRGQLSALQVAMILQEEMESAVSLSVPLTAEAAMGETWYDAKG